MRKQITIRGVTHLIMNNIIYCGALYLNNIAEKKHKKFCYKCFPEYFKRKNKMKARQLKLF